MFSYSLFSYSSFSYTSFGYSVISYSSYDYAFALCSFSYCDLTACAVSANKILVYTHIYSHILVFCLWGLSPSQVFTVEIYRLYFVRMQREVGTEFELAQMFVNSILERVQ